MTTETTVHLMDPSTLLVDVNIRQAVAADSQFVDSLRQFGVLQPIIGVRTANGEIRVRYGHRRALGAIEASLATVPVLIAGDESTDKAAEVERILTQYAENEHRAGLTAAEELGVVEQLRLLDVSQAAIAKKTGLSRSEVKHAVAVTGSETARAAHAEHDLTLEHAAALVEFEDDPEAVETLVHQATRNPNMFQHSLSLARQRRDNAKAIAAFVETDVAPLGFPVIDPPMWNAQPKALNRLTTPEGQDITPEFHATCPGHVTWAYEDWRYFRPDGTLVPEDSEEADELDGQDEPETAEWRKSLLVEYGCSDPGRYGHTVDGKASTTAGMSDDERQAAAKSEAEAKLLERRMVVANNKAWDAAEPVRRQWVQDNLAGRKTLPKGAGEFIAATLINDTYMLNGQRYTASKYGFLPEKESAWLTEVSEGRAQVVALMLILTAYEDFSDRQNWRSKPKQTDRYLRWLDSQRYPLSDIERVAAGLDPVEAD